MIVFCNKILTYATCNFHRKLNYGKEHEAVFSELLEQEFAKLSVTDDYFKDAYNFTVRNHDIAISDEQLAKAYKGVPANRRNMILFWVLSGLREGEIVEQFNLI